MFSVFLLGADPVAREASCGCSKTRAAINENIPWLKTPDDRRVRFLNPALIGRSFLSNPFHAINHSKVKYPQSKMKDVLLSGCTASEYSYDARIGGKKKRIFS